MFLPIVVHDTSYFHECWNPKNACPELAAAHSPDSGQYIVSAGEALAALAGPRRDRGQERRACAAGERGGAGGFRVAAARDRGRRRRGIPLRDPSDRRTFGRGRSKTFRPGPRRG